MGAIHDHEIHPGGTPRLRGPEVAELLVLPACFAALIAVWPLTTGLPSPWFWWAGLGIYGGLAGWAVGAGVRGARGTR